MRLPPWVDDCLRLIVPPRCACCGAAGAGGEVCPGCRADLPWNRVCCPVCAQPLAATAPCRKCLRRPPAFDAAWTPFRYEDPVRPRIQQFKYAAAFDQGRLLGRLMAEALAQRHAPLPDLVLVVPIARRRLYRRGYNQVVELARTLAASLPLEFDLGAARLQRPVADQIGRSAAQRRRNLRGAYAIDRDLRGRHVALLDDVMTTGATLDALARAARRAGAARIEAWALARAP